jgi:hypothetical protein
MSRQSQSAKAIVAYCVLQEIRADRETLFIHQKCI